MEATARLQNMFATMPMNIFSMTKVYHGMEGTIGTERIPNVTEVLIILQFLLERLVY